MPPMEELPPPARVERVGADGGMPSSTFVGISFGRFAPPPADTTAGILMVLTTRLAAIILGSASLIGL